MQMQEYYEDELPDAVYRQITDLSKKGNKFEKKGQFDEAIKVWEEALALVPEPRAKWDAALWLYAALGSACRRKGQPEDARRYFDAAYRAADGYTNAYVLYSLGAVSYDLGEKDKAVDLLLRAYMLEGERIFKEDGGVSSPYFRLLEDKELVQRRKPFLKRLAERIFSPAKK